MLLNHRLDLANDVAWTGAVDVVAQLQIGSTSFEVLRIKQKSPGVMALTLERPISQQPREKYGVLIRGSEREPVRIGLVLGTPELTVSVLY